MAHIVEHLSVEELEARYRASRDATEARHFQAVWLLAEGRTVLEVAEVLAFVPRWVEQLAARPNASGPGALGDRRRHNGRTASLLTPEALSALAARLKRPPEDGGLWSGPKVAAWMARTSAGGGASAARLGGAAADRWSLQAPRPRHPRAAHPSSGRLQKGARRAVARARAAHPDRPVEVWAEDEHRLGLKPVRRRVWAPVGERPVALGHHRYEWLHVVAFVQPTSGEAVWYLSAAFEALFEALLAGFARQTGAGASAHRPRARQRGSAWPEGLAVPDGISLVFLPPYSPELQPAERLWPLVDEPFVNRHLASLAELDAVIAERCRRLDATTIQPHTNFHWWPKRIAPK
jgi:hypothetical protein